MEESYVSLEQIEWTNPLRKKLLKISSSKISKQVPKEVKS